MPTPLHVLLLEDQPADAQLVLHALRRDGFAPVWRRVDTEANFLAALDPSLDLILADYALPQFDALRALELLRARGLDIPFIIVSGTIGEDSAVVAMQRGAADYLLKDRLGRLGAAVERALQQRRLLAEKLGADQLLRDSEQRFRALTEHAPDGITLIDGSGRLSYASPSSQHILGYDPGEMLGRDPAELTHPDDLPLLVGVLYELMQQPGRTSTAQYRFRHKNGSWRWIESTISNLLAEPGVGGVAFNYRDITERKQAEAQIAQLNADLERRVLERTADLGRINADLQAEIAERAQLERQVQRHADNATALADISRSLAEAGYELQPLFDLIVDHSVRMLGDASILTTLSDDRQSMQVMALGHAQPEGVAFLRSLFPLPYPAGEGMAGRVVQTGQPLLMPVVPPEQVRAQIQPGYAAYLDRFGIASLLIVPLRSRGRILGTLGVSRDQPGREYTDQDQTFLQNMADRAGLAIENARLFASEQQARAEAERANRAKDEFLASMSHELRTPLNAVLGFAEALQEEVYGPLNDRQSASLRSIETSGRHLLDLINDILDLAKIGAGALVLEPEQAPVAALCADCLRMIAPAALGKQLRMTSQLDPAVGALLADVRRLKQMLINLLSNAVKFTPAGGAIGLEVAGDPVRQVVELTVWDTGIGIAPQDLGRLFQPFAQLDSRLARQYNGAGLGLMLVARMAELHGGSVRVASELGVGSRFTIELPWRTPSGDRAAAEPPAAG